VSTPWLALAALVVASAAAGCVSDPPTTSSNPNGIVCTATAKVTGSFTLGQPQPADVFGCWPIGTWTFTATVDSNMCAAAPTVLSQYQFKGVETTDTNGDPLQTFTYLTDPATHNHVKVSEIGGSRCQAGVELYSPDGTQYWNFKPTLQADKATVDGFGEFTLYQVDQWN
jgi:hypothetical protein